MATHYKSILVRLFVNSLVNDFFAFPWVKYTSSFLTAISRINEFFYIKSTYEKIDLILTRFLPTDLPACLYPRRPIENQVQLGLDYGLYRSFLFQFQQYNIKSRHKINYFKI